MEFTYNGIVRWGWGFYNPNHAAALLCAIFPFLWLAFRTWRHWFPRIMAALAMAALIVMLALTFSRTGALVLAAEIIALAFCGGRRQKIAAVAAIAILVVGLAASGAFGRFVYDRAASNRLPIWNAGAELFAANPLSGVGVGNSGLLASTFLLPSGITCRTLINAHLTLIAEFGFLFGWLWLAIIVWAFFGKRKNIETMIAFGGLVISGCLSTVFDPKILLDLKNCGGLTRLNFALSWLLVLFYGAMAIYLCGYRPKWKTASIAIGAPFLMLLVTLVLFRRDATPLVSGNLVMFGTRQPLVLYDRDYTLGDVLKLFPEGFTAPMRPVIGLPPNCPRSNEVCLLGHSSDFAAHFPEAKLLLYSPSDYIALPANTAQLFLNRWKNHPQLEKQALERNIPVYRFGAMSSLDELSR